MAGQLQDPLIDEVLDGRYRVLQLLGRGGMGNVYLAEETRLRRRSALKVLHPHLAVDRSHIERFLREAQTIAQFEHPNIVDIFAYGEEPSGVVFFAMELLSGEDLDARIKASEQRPYSSHDACLWAVQIARAVAVVHDAGMIHRDLKVSNIFLARRRDGEEMVKLLDFGIARPEEGSELTATGVALGTPSYMSPEQIENRVVDRRSDIYSFGVLLFKLATGQLPFTGDAIQTALQHRDATPPRPTAIAPDAGISPAFERLILAMMAKDPRARPQTMHDVEAELLTLLADEAPELLPGVSRSGRPPTLPGTAARPITGRHGQLTPSQNAAPSVDATPASLVRTSPTGAIAAGTAPASRRLLYILGGGLVCAAVIVAVMTMRGDETRPAAPVAVAQPQMQPPTAPGEASRSVAQPGPGPKVEVPAETPAETPVETPVETPPAIDESGVKKPSERPAKAKPSPVEPPVVKMPADPLAQIAAKAGKCRRKLKLVDGPKISISYWINTAGLVRDVASAATGELADCLKLAVAQAQFEPKMLFNQKIEL